ncbi:MAG: RimK family protein, partial [Bdellovibrionales bacterium]|nr:RimK family protein [Bdellovibrionales bacterium]
MRVLLVVENPETWPLALSGVELVSARDYLRSADYSGLRYAKVYNLCESYRYQSLGYYVSLLAAARGHRPMPSVTAIQDMKLPVMARIASEELDKLIQQSLSIIRGTAFTLSIYFGKNMAKRYARLAAHLFDVFQAPLLRAQFARAGEKWVLQRIKPIAAAEIPEPHREFVVDAANQYFAKPYGRKRRRPRTRYDLAILYNPKDLTAPSNERAVEKFVRAAQSVGLSATIIGREDYPKLAEFDALFIRETTSVTHYTYRFSRRAAAEGLIVIDDPESIVRCTNKVYLAELLLAHKLPTPQTMIVHRDNARTVSRAVGLPCVLKQPDSSDSLGVWKAETEEQLAEFVQKMLERSEMIVAQPFLPTAFDWRIGILDGKPLYACRYLMAKNHWQITEWGRDKPNFGKTECVPLEDVPGKVLKVATKAARLMGTSLYGVDVKLIDKTPYVIEVNDNPSIEAGGEDQLLGMKLYEGIMSVFLERIEQSKARR